VHLEEAEDLPDDVRIALEDTGLGLEITFLMSGTK
jgi:hypothetical protein